MTEESKVILLGNKCANIILSLAEMFNLTVPQATDIFYKSETATLIEEGIADLQCRSDRYLATLVWEEYQEAHAPAVPVHNA